MRVNESGTPIIIDTDQAYPGPGVSGKLSWGEKSIPGSSRVAAMIISDFTFDDPQCTYYCAHSLMNFLEKHLSPDRDHFLSDELVTAILWEPLAGLFPTASIPELDEYANDADVPL